MIQRLLTKAALLDTVAPHGRGSPQLPEHDVERRAADLLARQLCAVLLVAGSRGDVLLLGRDAVEGAPQRYIIRVELHAIIDASKRRRSVGSNCNSSGGQF